jgi:hypothetical protein
VRRLWLVLLLTFGPAGLLVGQRPKPAYDPETKDGLLIQHIQQETDPAQKLHYMEEFVAENPNHPALAWVYDQLQPAYFKIKAWDETIRVGDLRMALEPDNLEAGELALRAAEAKHDPDKIIEWVDRVWPLATALAQRGGPAAINARQAAAYAEFLMYSIATSTDDPKKRLELLGHLEKHMPTSKYAQGLAAEYFEIYRMLNDEPKSIAMAEKELQTDPGNAEMLVYLAEIHARKDTPRDRQIVISYTARALESMDRMPRPPAVSEAEWEKKKAGWSTTANYLGGVSNSLLHNYSKADGLLRAAVAAMEASDPRLAAALYHLGMANYRLAETGHDRNRPVDALKFMRRCAAIRSPFQEQALKNIEGIKAEYSLQ